MPATAGETFYDLAARALAAQESEVASLRTRAGTLVAGAAVVATLLAKPIFSRSHPDGVVEWCTAALGFAGMAALLVAAVYLLRSHNLAFGVDVDALYDEAGRRGDLAEDADVNSLHARLALALADQHASNAPTIVGMRSAIAAALTGIIAEVVGLGLASALT
jgi:hypothetical protein